MEKISNLYGVRRKRLKEAKRKKRNIVINNERAISSRHESVLTILTPSKRPQLLINVVSLSVQDCYRLDHRPKHLKLKQIFWSALVMIIQLRGVV